MELSKCTRNAIMRKIAQTFGIKIGMIEVTDFDYEGADDLTVDDKTLPVWKVYFDVHMPGITHRYEVDAVIRQTEKITISSVQISQEEFWRATFDSDTSAGTVYMDEFCERI